jgi:hypothetical protein
VTFPRPSRWFPPDDILAGTVNLDGYPLRYIYISATPFLNAALNCAFRSNSPSPRVSSPDEVMSAVELLEARGWDLVQFEQGGMIAYLRRNAS